MKYIYYSFKRDSTGWTIVDSKLKCKNYCNKSLLSTIRAYLWYMGMPAQKALNLFRRNKIRY